MKTTLKQWIVLDDEERSLRNKIKEIRESKIKLSSSILGFMKENSVDNFSLEGSAAGNISRSVRTIRPPIKRNQIRTQLLLHFSDQPQRVAEALRAIEGVSDDISTSSAISKELLIRRIPRTI